MMRKFLVLAFLAAMPAAEAAPLMAPSSMQPAIAEASPVQTVACIRYGWRGWGAYPGCYRRPVYAVTSPYSYYAAAPVYVAPPVYAEPLRRCWIAGAWRLC